MSVFYTWKIAFRNPHFRNKFILNMIAQALLLSGLAYLLNYIETRQGHVFYDPVLNFIKPRDVSDSIFLTTYGTAIIAIAYALGTPYKFIHFIQMYAMLTALRIITLFFVPLDPPVEIIPLHDKFLSSTFYQGKENVKDLFFSGHAATLFMFFFFAENRFLKYFFLAAAFLVSACVIIQHVHYSYDVIAAPFFAYISYRLVTRYSKHYHLSSSSA
ncbi:MAG: hypothetical protein JST26_01285 [Bacteroidetes bacterium]|nr:hypothetical protein [Bacteroidota bacterium]